MDETIMRCADIGKSFGGVSAVNEACVKIYNMEICGLIGTNGAGKTTLFNILTGFETPDQGQIFIHNKKVSIKGPQDAVKYKIARTFQSIKLFPSLNVAQNIEVAHKAAGKSHIDIKPLLLQSRLYDKRFLPIYRLSYGQMRLCEIVRALATGCRILFLDEPAAGMNPAEKLQLSEFLQNARKDLKLSIFVIEHDMAFISSLCQRVYMMHQGQIAAHGQTRQVLESGTVRRLLMGEE